MSDPIADMLTRIRNAYLARKAEVLVPYSRLKWEIAKILQQEKYITNVEVEGEPFKTLKITNRYNQQRPALSVARRISHVGRRIYVGKDRLPRVLNGFGLAIVSTSKGLMTNKQARKLGVGGEVICEIY